MQRHQHFETGQNSACSNRRPHPALTQALVAALQAQGVRTTADRSEAKAVLAIRGDVVLLGGPVFPKGTKVAMGEALSKIQASLDVRAEATKTP